MNKKIFVQIASYRDSELSPTIKDLYTKAKYPDRINVGICLQVDPEHDKDCMLENPKSYPGDVRIIQHHPKKSTGLGKARYLAQSLFENEDYVLQLDSHIRCEQDWDEILINQLNECASEKSIISGALPSYAIPDDCNKDFIASSVIGKFVGKILMAGTPSSTFENRPEKPVLGHIISGHFMFASAQLFKEVPFDPYIYFEGEEILLSVKFWTHGWDIYYPNVRTLYHCFNRDHRAKCWEDDTDWQKLDNISKERIAYLFGSSDTKDPEVLKEIHKYGLGTVRSLADYEKFIGVDFKTQTITEKELTQQPIEIKKENKLISGQIAKIASDLHKKYQQQKATHPKIFVQIPAYRDSELEPTVNDMYAKAKYPERINVGICLQVDPEHDKDCMISNPKDYAGEIRIEQRHPQESKGLGWARSIAQSLWQGEKYYLQIDSHMRFEQDWDEILINQLNECDSEKPILTGLPPAYFLPNDTQSHKHRLSSFYMIGIYNDVIFDTQYLEIKPEDRPKKPSLINYINGSFVFSSSQIIKDVPIDPYIYFYGDEPAISLRYWTYGWDMFYPNIPTLYHLYHRAKREAIFNQHHKNGEELASKTYKRIGYLFGIVDEKDPDIIKNPEIIKDIEKYWLGSVRTIEQYQKAFGIDLKNKTVTPRIIKNGEVVYPCMKMKEYESQQPAEIKKENKLSSDQITKIASDLHKKHQQQKASHLKIFVQIPAYRDSELEPTVNDMYAKAKYPERINVGICLQVDPEHDKDCMISNPKAYAGEIRIEQRHPQESKGLGWARSIAQSLWQGEEYCLQIDSHMRFEQDWDEILIKTLNECDSKKPILSSWLPAYHLLDNRLDRHMLGAFYINRFWDDIIIGGQTLNMLAENAPDKPIMQNILSGHFMFSSSEIIKEILYDPYIYFYGEETSFMPRAWTHGWDFFCPHVPTLYHLYTRQHRKVHWNDHSEQEILRLKQITKERLRYLLGVSNTTDPEVLKDIEKYRLGTVRTLADYEKFAGIDIKNRKVFLKFAVPKGRYIYPTTEIIQNTTQKISANHSVSIKQNNMQNTQKDSSLKKTYDFTNQWFKSVAQNNFDRVVLPSKPLKILEIGSYEGSATSYLVEKLGTQDGFELHCIDTWEAGLDDYTQKVDMNSVESRFNHNLKVALDKCSKDIEFFKHKMFSDRALVNLLYEKKNNYFDFIYVDGSHTSFDVLSDAILAFKLLKVGGIIGFDDYLWKEAETTLNKNILKCPKIAIDNFTNIYFNKLEIFNLPAYQMYMRKVAD